jgi:hypothetical protein
VDALVAVLLGAAETLRGWGDSDLRAFLDGKRSIVVRVPPRTTAKRASDDERIRSLAGEVRAELGEMDSREAGLLFLDQLRLGRDDLRRLVSALDLPVSHSDNMDRLRARIVEGLIGYRLGSQAIRGKPTSLMNKREQGDENKSQ